MTTDHHHDTDEDSADRHETAASDAVADWEPEIEPSADVSGGGGDEPALISPGRLEAFSDGVIAIAITLLSLEIKLPEDGGSLLRSLAFLPFATSVLTRSLESGHDERTGAVFYGAVMVVGGLFFNALWRAAIRDRSRLRPGVTQAEVRSMTRRFAMGPWLYALAALLGLVSAWLSVVTYVALIVFYMAGHRPRIEGGRVSPAGG